MWFLFVWPVRGLFVALVAGVLWWWLYATSPYMRRRRRERAVVRQAEAMTRGAVRERQ
jgi:hypothetical protein